MNLIIRNDKPYAFETWIKGSFMQKSWSLDGPSEIFCRATWRLQQISPLLTVKKRDDFHISDSLTVRSCTISYCIVCNYVNYIE